MRGFLLGLVEPIFKRNAAAFLGGVTNSKNTCIKSLAGGRLFFGILIKFKCDNVS